MSKAEYSKLRIGAILTVEETFFELLVNEMNTSEYGGLTPKQIKLIATKYVNKENIKNKKDFIACCSEYNIQKSGFFEEQSPNIYNLPIETKKYFQSLKSSNGGAFDTTKTLDALNEYFSIICQVHKIIENLSLYENKNTEEKRKFKYKIKHANEKASEIRSEIIKNNNELINATNNFSVELLNLEYIENESYEKYKKIESFKEDRLIPFRVFFRKRNKDNNKTPAEMIDEILMILRKRDEILDVDLKTTINSFKLLSKIIKSISGDFSGIVSKLSGLLESKEKDLEMQKTTSIFLEVLKKEQAKLADGSVQRVNSWYLPIINNSKIFNRETTKEIQGEGAVAIDEISLGIDSFFEKLSEEKEIEDVVVKRELSQSQLEELNKNAENKKQSIISSQIRKDLNLLAHDIMKSNYFLLGEELDIFKEVLNIFKNNYKNTNKEINPNLVLGGVNKVTHIIKNNIKGRFRTKRIKRCDYLNKNYQTLVFKKTMTIKNK